MGLADGVDGRRPTRARFAFSWMWGGAGRLRGPLCLVAIMLPVYLSVLSVAVGLQPYRADLKVCSYEAYMLCYLSICAFCSRPE